ncbi:hypothetical protein AGABI1DRAFT_129208 [Agaricus bisporus var. burnettii JB137-S8]|uniref:Uncharacterized protein n=1 Tax=Agaricus bisporus var. burnettii (strain JB137-S8 / ATCC MYA-4627 / FGSC 10392) TaxID=597362 RepID=K5X7H6_AGABU|nr:uncharacterized protein AGABI1DRAFT_129208 [Agaricus bisporus var. burnettii JB137-S8]EKM78937.1 hypothetical protein AGABI1DRAFT_129208 [Agaricus bisporus var. burnettii JB137-S8]
MTMHPELEEAFNTGLSMQEVFSIFTKHHSGPIEERIETGPSRFKKLVHTDCAFWDNWKPLFLRVPYHSLPGPESVDVPFMSIHKALTREIISWLCDSKRRSNVYLISETRTAPLFIYGNTRAHIFANVCYDAHRFGLPMRIEPYSFWGGIDSLIAALATCYPPYRRILTRELIDNPAILKMPTRTRFKKLIHEPWQALQESHPQYTFPSPVVVVGWDPIFLDEELLRSIYEFGSSPHSSSLLWIISVDTDIKLPIQDLLHPSVPFHYYRLPVCYKEGPEDATLLLYHQFNALRCEYEIFDKEEIWPSQEQMSHLTRIVAGVFETVQVIIQFVDWEDDGGPKAHLETFLTYMTDSPSPSNEQPYCALDHFYTRVFSNIPPDLLSVFKQVFSIVDYRDCYPERFLELSLTCLLPLGKEALLTVLPHVYRLVVAEADMESANPWIGPFLRDATRAGRFYTPPSESRLCVFQAFLHILRHAPNPTAMLKLVVQKTQASTREYCSVIDSLRQSASYEFGRTGAALVFDQPFLVSTLLCHFDFRCLAYTCDKIHLSGFMEFLRILYLVRDDPPDIVRIEPVSVLDKQLIGKCEGLAEPLDLEKMQVPQDSEEYKEWALSHVKNPKYVLLGFESETVLAVLATREGNGEWDLKGVSIYTPAMPDDM